MSKDNYIRAQKGTLTMGQLIDLEKSLYITDLADFYNVKYEINKHNNRPYEKGMVLNRKVRESTYVFLMDAFSKDGKEPRDITTKILTRYTEDELYDNLVQLEGIGPKNAILATIALTGNSPSIVKHLSNEVADAMFVSSEQTNLVIQSVNNVTPSPEQGWSYRDSYSTTIDCQAAYRMLLDFSAVVREKSGFKDSALPTQEEIMEEVRKRTVMVGDMVMLKSQYDLEQKLVGLTKIHGCCVKPNSHDEYMDILSTWGMDDYQRKAFDMVICGDDKVSCITGKAGAGKSHVISAIYRAYKGRCVLTAYQNSACDVLSRRVGGYEFCGQPIKAIIGLSMKLTANAKFADEFQKNAHVVVVDESSQIGTAHLHHILNIMNHAAPDAKLVFVGDILQTRPVCTYGLPFVHLVKGGYCKVSDLAEFHRTNGRGILELCERIRSASNQYVDIEPGCEGVELNQIPESEKYMDNMYKDIANAYIDAGDDVGAVMVISEFNNDCDRINRMVTAHIFNEPPVTSGLPMIRKGMFVVSTKNEQSISSKAANQWKITNGSRYYVMDFTGDFIVLKDRNGDVQNVPVSKIESKTFKPAYAITVHKSQGSEARNVTYVFRRHRDFSNAFCCDKTLKYVAFSRAQESLTLDEIYNPMVDREYDKIYIPLTEQNTYTMSF